MLALLPRIPDEPSPQITTIVRCIRSHVGSAAAAPSHEAEREYTLAQVVQAVIEIEFISAVQGCARTVTQGFFRCWERCSERRNESQLRDNCQRNYLREREFSFL